MKSNLLCTLFLSQLLPACAVAQLAPPSHEIFSIKKIVCASPLRQPFAMVMGPNDSLWITERRGFVTRVSTIAPYNKTQLLNLGGIVKFTTSGSGSSMSISQDGMFGIALHPDLNRGKGTDYVYIAYCYDSLGNRRTRIVRYTYGKTASMQDTLKNAVILLSNIWGSNDHNSGRLVIGNFGTAAVPDYKLMYSVGDRGANQFANACDSIDAQYIPTAANMAAGNLRRYSGKTLRLNLDGSIPADNPIINGVRTHIWSYGHRNPQGLTFEKDNNNILVPKGKLYSSEQGPATSDEINIIDSANNYGWPKIAGKRDNNWYKYYKWAGTSGCSSYSSECSSIQTNSGANEFAFTAPRYTDPIFDLYPGAPPTVGGVPNTCNWLTYPTIAPSSVIYYPYSGKIPGWDKCLLITTLKTSSMFRLKLNAAGTAPALTAGAGGNDSVIQYFNVPAALNRYRDIALGSDGYTIYLLTDSVGTTSGPSGAGATVTDRGTIVMYKYIGTVLAIGTDPVNNSNPSRLNFSIYPNPASQSFFVQCKKNTVKPLRYQLYDAAGREVLKGSSNKDKFEVNVSRLVKGIYFIKLFNAYDINVDTEKIIVN